MVELYVVASVVYKSLILVVAIVLNCGVCHVMLFSYKKIELTHAFLVSISIADILQTTLGLVPEILFDLRAQEISVNSLCVFSSVATFAFAIVNIFHLVVLSVSRTAALKSPLVFRSVMNQYPLRSALMFICYAYGILWSVLPLFDWSVYTLDADKKRCSLDWHLTHSNSLSYIITVFLMCYCFPGLLIIGALSYSRYTIEFKRTRLVRNRSSSISGQRKNITLLENNYLKIFTVSAIMFYALWTPYSAMCVLAMFRLQPPAHLSTVCAMIAKLSAIVNPIVNCMLSAHFRRRFLQLKILFCFDGLLHKFQRSRSGRSTEAETCITPGIQEDNC